MCILQQQREIQESATPLTIGDMPFRVEFFNRDCVQKDKFCGICNILTGMNASTTVYTFMYSTNGGYTWGIQYVFLMCFEEQDQKGSFLSMLNYRLVRANLPQFQEQRRVPYRYMVGIPVDILPIECPDAPMKEVVSIDRRLGRPPQFPSLNAPSIAKTEEMDRRAKAGNLFPRPTWGEPQSKEGKTWTVLV
jgi:hypothetical protein